MGFRFKQFVIDDNGCAMKVGTDSIMLGSWVTTKQAQHILDIGTGSGLLAIMLAQKSTNSSRIIGIDIDKQSVDQASLNGQKCPWSQQLSFQHCSLQLFQPATTFDLIVCNPPYFSPNSSANLQAQSKNRPIARQTVALNHQFLLQWVSDHLSNDGRFCCVLPFDSACWLLEQAKSMGLFCQRSLHVSTKPKGDVSRQLMEFSRINKEHQIDTLTIYTQARQYSQEYIQLCKDYYENF